MTKTGRFGLKGLLFVVAGLNLALGPALAQQASLLHPLSGILAAPVSLRVITDADGGESYIIQTGGKWLKGKWAGSGVDHLHAVLVDLDFDGNADIWITGYTDGQGRDHPSDVWRYQPLRAAYVLDPVLSALPNLEVDLAAKRLQSSIPNCGCAGQCFLYEEYDFAKGALRKISAREQTCQGKSVVYRESRLSGGKMRVTSQVSGDPGDETSRQRRKSPLNFVDWAKYDGRGETAVQP